MIDAIQNEHKFLPSPKEKLELYCQSADILTSPETISTNPLTWRVPDGVGARSNCPLEQMPCGDAFLRLDNCVGKTQGVKHDFYNTAFARGLEAIDDKIRWVW